MLQPAELNGLNVIVLEPENLLIFTPTGVNADAIHSKICSKQGSYWVIGTNSITWADEATTRIPVKWMEYRRALVVRNPYTRLLSLLEEYNQERDDLAGPVDLATFSNDIGGLNWNYSETINQWAASVQPYEIIRYESLSKDIKRVTGRACRIALSDYGDWLQRYSRLNPDLLIYLYRYFSEDLIRYGYNDIAITPTRARLLGGKQ